MSSLLPTPEPADPVEGALGHFEHSNWVKAGLKALDANIFRRSGGTITGDVTLDKRPLAVALNLTGLSVALHGYADAAQEVARNAWFGGIRRWKEALTTATWTLQRFDSSGTLVGTVLQFSNSTGLGTVAGDPTSALGIATKQYADAKVVNTLAGSSTTAAPSQASVNTGLSGKAASSHSHAGADITSGTVAYARLPVGTGAAQVSQGTHTHDDRYYTEAEVASLLSGKSDTSHTHDERYYTEAAVNSLLANRPAFKYGRHGTPIAIGANQSTGNINIAHGLGRSPYAVLVSADDDGGDASVFASVESWDATYIYAQLRNLGDAESHVYINWIAF